MLSLNAETVARFNIISILTFFCCLILNRKGLHGSAFSLAYVEVNIHAFVATHYLGWEAGFYQYPLILAPLVFFNATWSVPIKIIFSTLIAVSFTVLFNVYHEQLYGQILYDVTIGHTLLYINTIIIVVIYSAIGYYYSQAANDIEDRLRTAQQEAEWLANTDTLTHIGNRRAMTREIELEVSRTKRTQRPFIIAMCDIDNFKILNDTYGHDYGDHVLVETATFINNSIRHHDHVARWGGEEFIILLPDTNADEGMKIVDRLRQSIAANKHHYSGKEYPGITMTFGLSVFDNSININDCINSADQAMYEGKHQGRNRTVMSAAASCRDDNETQSAA
jgi:diguanylate cyclase (GGDEF)-like protein